MKKVNEIDIQKIKKDIEQEKRKKREVAEALGESIEVPVTSDKFLNELLTSVNYGVNSPVVKKIKEVSKISMEKDVSGINNNINQKSTISEAIASHMPTNRNHNHYNNNNSIPTNNNINYNAIQSKEDINNIIKLQEREREEQLLAEYKRKERELLNNNGGMKNVTTPLSSLPHPQQQNYGQNSIITEQVNARVDNFLNENFAKVITAALKNVIIEQYKTERVEKAINENIDLIKKIVVDTIIELKERQKEKGNKK